MMDISADPASSMSIDTHSLDHPMSDIEAKPRSVTNGVADDLHIADAISIQTPENHNHDASPSDTSVATRPAPDDEDDMPPAKRARRLSDAEQASLVHVSVTTLPVNPTPTELSPQSTNGTNGISHADTAAPAPEPSPAPASTAPVTFSQQQYKFCLSTVRQLKKSKDAIPFLTPVDAIGLGIPHYFTIIKHPMDFSTVEKKIQSSNPSKPDPNLANPRYRNADEFIADVKLIFQNTCTFNGLDHVISIMGKRLEAQFDKSIKHMPPAVEVRLHCCLFV